MALLKNSLTTSGGFWQYTSTTGQPDPSQHILAAIMDKMIVRYDPAADVPPASQTADIPDGTTASTPLAGRQVVDSSKKAKASDPTADNKETSVHKETQNQTLDLNTLKSELKENLEKVKRAQTEKKVSTVEDMTEAFHAVEALIYQSTPNAEDTMLASAALEKLTAIIPANASEEYNEVLAACFMLSADLKLRGVYQPPNAGNKIASNRLLGPNLTEAIEDYTIACRVWDENGEAHLQVAKLYFQLAVTGENLPKNHEYLELAKIYLSEVTKKNNTSDNYKIARFISEILIETEDLSDFGAQKLNNLKKITEQDNLLHLDFATTLLNRRGATDRDKFTALEYLTRAAQELQSKSETVTGAPKTEQEHLTKSRLYLITYDMRIVLQKGADQLKKCLSDLREACSAMIPDAFYAYDHVAKHFQKKFKDDAQQKDFIQKNIGDTDVMSADCSKYAAVIGGTQNPFDNQGQHISHSWQRNTRSYYSSKLPYSTTAVGMRNSSGADCYANTAIQMLFSMPSVSKYLDWAHSTMKQRLNLELLGKEDFDLLAKNNDFCLFKSLVELKKEYNDAFAKGNAGVLNSSPVLVHLRKNIEVAPGVQEDSSEAMMALMANIDLHFSSDIRNVPEMKKRGKPYQTTYRHIATCDDWSTYLQADDGKSLLPDPEHCPPATVENLLSVAQPISTPMLVLQAGGKSETISNMIRESMSPNQIESWCDACNQRTEHKDFTVIEKFADDLLLYFNIFGDYAGARTQVNEVLDILWDFDMRDYMYGSSEAAHGDPTYATVAQKELQGEQGKKLKYQLKSLAVRPGNFINFGHFFVYKREGAKWHRISDSSTKSNLTQADVEQGIKNHPVYYACYERIHEEEHV